MLGAIIGDIVGSRFEFNNHRSKDFDLFTKGCFITDDSIMTLAVAKAIMETEKCIEPSISGYDSNGDYYRLLSKLTVKYMQEIGRKYPNCGYGGRFARWVFSDNPKPYNSFGNGAAMRISPAGLAARTELEATSFSEAITSVTHDHEEGIKGAEATAVAIFLARHGFLKSEIRDRLSKNYYPLDFTIDQIRPTYKFSETCQETVPQAITCFLESNSFEDAIRTAISLGGDSDTIAAITGAIAEAYYGVPDAIRDKALTYLDDELRAIYDEWEKYNAERMAVVETIEYFEPTSVPFPLDKTKHIIGKWPNKENHKFPFDKLVLCNEGTPYIKVKVWAEIKDGCLKISGQDLGKAAEDTFGEDEYEYFYEFDRENTERLFALLTPEAQKVKEVFMQKFSGMDGCRSLREFCEENGITYRFFSC
jgi:ADP-ribosyl-[dinitrogen reductase] hydrolase